MNNSVMSDSLAKQTTVVVPNESSCKKVDLLPLPGALADADFDLPVTAFVLPNSTKAWVGYQHDAYVELDSGIVGLMVRDSSGFIDWRNSIVQNAKSKDALLAAAPTAETLRLSLSEKERTDIRNIFADSDFFAAGPRAANAGKIEVSGIDFADDLLKIELENLTTSRQGQVWIDPQTREIRKAMENGKQTFPKSE